MERSECRHSSSNIVCNTVHGKHDFSQDEATSEYLAPRVVRTFLDLHADITLHSSRWKPYHPTFTISSSTVEIDNIAVMANDPRESAKISETSGDFRDYLIPLDHPRLHPNDRDARTHAKGVLGNEEIFLTPVARGWVEQYHQPYKGFTTDGNVVPDIWHFVSEANGPTSEMVDAARTLMDVASASERKQFSYPVDAREWRSWSNPEVIACCILGTSVQN